MLTCSNGQKAVKKNFVNGFALPTVLIASFIMLTVLLVSVASTAAIKVALVNQYYDQLARNASDAGSAYARACLVKDDGYPNWTDEKPLKPNTDCNGTETLSCPDDSTNVLCAVTISGNIRSTFSVPKPEVDIYGRALDVKANGYTKLLRASNGTVWRQYVRASKIDKRINTNLDSQIKRLAVAGGSVGHNCSIGIDNLAYCWGSNVSGQLGIGSSGYGSTGIQSPVYTGGVLSGKTIKYITANNSVTCVIASDDKAYCWGANGEGQLGNGTQTASSSPVAMNGNRTIKAISIGNQTVCYVTIAGDAYCAGSNVFGEAGNNSASPGYATSPVAVYTGGVLSGKTVKTISTSVQNVCAIASDDKAYCWGYNKEKLGNNTTGWTQRSPVAVFDGAGGVLNGKTIKKLSGTCVIASDNKAYCWGYTTGDGTFNLRLVPVAVDTSGVLNGLTLTEISTNGPSCVLASNGKLYCWGSNNKGQLGDGTTTNRPSPVEVSTENNLLSGKTVKSFTTGGDKLCIVTTEDYSFCLGDNTYHALGDGTTTSSSKPVENAPLPNWRDDFVNY